MGILDVLNATKIKEENASLREEQEQLRAELSRLRQVFDDIGGSDVEKAKAKLQEYNAKSRQLMETLIQLARKTKDTNEELEAKRKELLVVEDELLLESFALYKPKFALTNSVDYKTKLEAVRENQKQLIRGGFAVKAQEKWTVNGSSSEGKKMVEDMKKLLLRSFNNECDYCVDNVKFSNIDTFEKRIEKSFESMKKLGRILDAEVTEMYKRSKLDELYLAFEYQVKKQEEKEEQRKAREILREQQKVEQEIRAARERIAKEKKHFQAAIRQLQVKLDSVGSLDEKIAIEQKLSEVTEQCAALEGAEREIDYREKNAKAGYVYIISNLGAFGSGVYKIGMTRRLEPLERIDELGDASVPFEFDIHALIFSDDAPALEAKLHGHFDVSRVNKMNRRKEFFRADIREIESVVRKNYDKVFDLVHEPAAEQFRESQRV